MSGTLGGDWVAEVIQSSGEEFVTYLVDQLQLDQFQTEVVMQGMLQCGGACAVFADITQYKALLQAGSANPFSLRDGVTFGSSVFMINVFGYTAEEELALLGHEFGHVMAGVHDNHTYLPREKEADRMACFTAGPMAVRKYLERLLTTEYIGVHNGKYDENLLDRYWAVCQFDDA